MNWAKPREFRLRPPSPFQLALQRMRSLPANVSFSAHKSSTCLVKFIHKYLIHSILLQMGLFYWFHFGLFTLNLQKCNWFLYIHLPYYEILLNSFITGILFQNLLQWQSILVCMWILRDSIILFLLWQSGPFFICLLNIALARVSCLI